MDKDTRNAIERATQRARKLLEEDFSSQLEGTFDVLRTGTIAPKAGAHLSVRQGFQRDKIVAAIEHKRAAGMTAADAVTDYVRDAAFTTLNRFVALKMLEARDLVQECITKGDQSMGYREFCGMAPGVALLPDAAGYRLYIESLFDELSTEVKVLFDRRDAASVLWPKRQYFDETLTVLNEGDLGSAWAQEETIGWVYQFFNGPDERRAMRDASQAPRTSRELAVRNQFFTPRYVVRFLLDNTLGRQWVQQLPTASRLCHTRAFLYDRETAARPDAKPRDPRELRVLDPACGSAHFLLYAYDLLEEIYEEAWTVDPQPDRDTGRRLRDDYPTLDSLRLALPNLILGSNLFGVDIDSRCIQIAALALWLRAQQTYSRNRVPRELRPQIAAMNLAVAEPVATNGALLAEFTQSLTPGPLAGLFGQLLDAFRPAGELGSLLDVEAQIDAIVASEASRTVQGSLFQPGATKSFWDTAASELLSALQRYADAADATTRARRRLFASDSSHAVGLIRILRGRFDAVVMNPPFGEAIEHTFKTLERLYPRSKRDLATAFVDRGLALLAPGGSLGVLLSRKLFFVDTQAEWRRHILGAYTLSPCADLGHRVLDGALVEVAAAVMQRPQDGQSVGDAQFIACLAAEDKERALLDAVTTRNGATEYHCSPSSFLSLPSAQFAYNTSPRLLRAFERLAPLEPAVAIVRMGLTTSDNERFLRLAWEFPYSSTAMDWRSRWVRLAKGGEYAPYYSDNELVVKYGDGKGELAAFGLSVGNEAQSRRSSKYYGLPALTYTERTASRFSVRCLPQSSIFSMAGPVVVVADDSLLLPCLGALNSNVFNALYELCLGGGDSVSSGSAARHYTTGFLGKMPFAAPDALRQISAKAVENLVALVQELASSDETDVRFAGLPTRKDRETIRQFIEAQIHAYEDRVVDAIDLGGAVEEETRRAFSLEDAGDELAAVVGRHPAEYRDREFTSSERDELKSLFESPIDNVIDRVAEHLGFPRYVTAKSYVVDRRYEVIAHRFAVHPRAVVAARRALGACPHGVDKEWFERLVSFGVGVAFGRWRNDGRAQWESGPFNAVPLVPACSAPSQQTPALVSVQGHPLDVVRRIENAVETALGLPPESLRHDLDEMAQELGPGSFRAWFDANFFDLHVRKYSRHRRIAPIFWRLGPPEFPCWLNYHAATSDSLFRLATEVVAPELRVLESRLEGAEGVTSGDILSSRERIQLRAAVESVRAFAIDLKTVAGLWTPHHEDGALLSAAPLWRLFSASRDWQKLASEEWSALRDEKREWSHLAMHLWPERVVPKCATDRSLALAHDLSDVFWVAGADGRWKARTTPTRPIADLVRERSSSAVKAALKSLLDVPVVAPRGGRRRGRRSDMIAEGGGAR
jgi:hypothetical protein